MWAHVSMMFRLLPFIVYASIALSFKPTFNFKLFNGNNFSFDLLKDKAIENSLQRLHFIISSVPFKEEVIQSPSVTDKSSIPRIDKDKSKNQDKVKETVNPVHDNESEESTAALFPTRLKIQQQAGSVDVVIREASVNDLGAIANLRVSVFYPEQKRDSSFHIQILDKIRKRITEEGSICLTVERNTYANGVSKSGGLFYGNTVGTVEFSPGDFAGTAMESIGAPRKVYVADLAIRADARRMGLATKMLEGIELYCQQKKYQEIYLHVEVENYIARKLYQKLGYVELAPEDHVIAFTETRLQKAATGYILLRKSVDSSISPISSVSVATRTTTGGSGDNNNNNNEYPWNTHQGVARSSPRVTTVPLSALTEHPAVTVSHTISSYTTTTDPLHSVPIPTHWTSTTTTSSLQPTVSAVWHPYQHTASESAQVEWPNSYSI